MTLSLANILIVFASNFASVFLLGIQSKNVNQSRYVAAIVTSFFISVAQATFIKYMSSGNLEIFFIAALGSCIGIACSIYFYDNIVKKKNGNN